jgi:cyclase
MRKVFMQRMAVVSLVVTGVVAYGQTPSTAFKPRIASGFSTDWAHLTMEKHELAPGLWFLHASGGNTVALVGSEGTMLVDPSFAQVAPVLQKTLAGMHAGNVRFVIDSHYHSDHSGANGAFRQQGAVLVAQENDRLRMMSATFSGITHKISPPAPEANWPTVTYDKHMVIHLDGEEVELVHDQPAHTDGDTIVYFKHANVVHLGDVFVNNLYPYIDLGVGGRVDGYFPMIDAVLARIDDKTVVIPGHGPIATKAQLRAYRDMIQTVRDRVAAQIAAGKTLDQVLAMKLAAEFDPQYATDRVDGNRFVTLVYESLTGTKDS